MGPFDQLGWAKSKATSAWRGALFGAVCGLALAGCGFLPGAPSAPGGPNDPGAAPPGQIAPGSMRTDAQMQKDRDALVSAMGEPAAPEVAAQFAGDFVAASEEPAWELTVNKDYISFRRANLEPIEDRPKKREVRTGGLLIETEELVVTIAPGECKFESGAPLPYTATVFWNGASFSGCARQDAAAVAGAAPVAKPSGWAVIIPRVLPAIDACLRRADAKPARVTIAYPSDGQATVAVRLIEADNGRAECVVASDGSAVRSYEALSDRDVFRGERDPLFTRSPTAAPAGRCDDSKPLTGADGAQIGWLTRNKC
jgi:uncharacterized membrane protein